MRLARVTGIPPSHRARDCALVALALAMLAVPTGCVRRRLAVRSNPPGALVYVDNQQIGTTPCSVDFTYYGTREIRLVKPGYETLTVNQPIPTPWYQIPPLDFVSENVMPNKIEDHRTVAFNLEPQLIVPTEQLLDRANQLRQETLQGAAAPPPPQTVVVPGPGGAPVTIPQQTIPQPTTAPPMFGPPETYGPTPTLAPAPASQPVPLPPVTVPSTMQTSPPPTFGTSTLPPTTLPPTTNPPGIVSPTPAPFSPPILAPQTLQTSPPSGSQEGRPLVSPPLR